VVKTCRVIRIKFNQYVFVYGRYLLTVSDSVCVPATIGLLSSASPLVSSVTSNSDL